MERLKIDEEKFTREIKSVIRLANPSYISGKSDVDLDDMLAYLRFVTAKENCDNRRYNCG